MPDGPLPEPIEHPISEYIAKGASEGAMLAAQRLSEAVGIELAEVLAAVQALGAWEPAVTITGKGSLTISSPVIGGTGRVVALADAGAGTDSLTVVRHADVEKLTDRASRGELPARLSANQRILVSIPNSRYLPRAIP